MIEIGGKSNDLAKLIWAASVLKATLLKEYPKYENDYFSRIITGGRPKIENNKKNQFLSIVMVDWLLLKKSIINSRLHSEGVFQLLLEKEFIQEVMLDKDFIRSNVFKEGKSIYYEFTDQYLTTIEKGTNRRNSNKNDTKNYQNFDHDDNPLPTNNSSLREIYSSTFVTKPSYWSNLREKRKSFQRSKKMKQQPSWIGLADIPSTENELEIKDDITTTERYSKTKKYSLINENMEIDVADLENAINYLAQRGLDALIKIILKKSRENRSLQELELIYQEISELKALSGLSLMVKRQLASVVMLEAYNHAKDRIIFRQGDEGTSWYVIMKGNVDVVIDGKGSVCTLNEGEDFGKLALINDSPRTASIIISNNNECLLLRVDKNDFNVILKDVEANTVRLNEHGQDVLILEKSRILESVDKYVETSNFVIPTIEPTPQDLNKNFAFWFIDDFKNLFYAPGNSIKDKMLDFECDEGSKFKSVLIKITPHFLNKCKLGNNKLGDQSCNYNSNFMNSDERRVNDLKLSTNSSQIPINTFKKFNPHKNYIQDSNNDAKTLKRPSSISGILFDNHDLHLHKNTSHASMPNKYQTDGTMIEQSNNIYLKEQNAQLNYNVKKGLNSSFLSFFLVPDTALNSRNLEKWKSIDNPTPTFDPSFQSADQNLQKAHLIHKPHSFDFDLQGKSINKQDSRSYRYFVIAGTPNKMLEYLLETKIIMFERAFNFKGLEQEHVILDGYGQNKTLNINYTKNPLKTIDTLSRSLGEKLFDSFKIFKHISNEDKIIPKPLLIPLNVSVKHLLTRSLSTQSQIKNKRHYFSLSPYKKELKVPLKKYGNAEKKSLSRKISLISSRRDTFVEDFMLIYIIFISCKKLCEILWRYYSRNGSKVRLLNCSTEVNVYDKNTERYLPINHDDLTFCTNQYQVLLFIRRWYYISGTLPFIIINDELQQEYNDYEYCHFLRFFEMLLESLMSSFKDSKSVNGNSVEGNSVSFAKQLSFDDRHQVEFHISYYSDLIKSHILKDLHIYSSIFSIYFREQPIHKFSSFKNCPVHSNSNHISLKTCEVISDEESLKNYQNLVHEKDICNSIDAPFKIGDQCIFRIYMENLSHLTLRAPLQISTKLILSSLDNNYKLNNINNRDDYDSQKDDKFKSVLIELHSDGKRKILDEDDINFISKLPYNSRIFFTNMSKIQDIKVLEEQHGPDVGTFEILDLMNSRAFAYYLTQYDWCLFKHIIPAELYGDILPNLKNRLLTANLNLFLRRFNIIQNWVCTELCLIPPLLLNKRVQLLRKFIKIAHHCKDFRNFNAFFAILMGLNDVCISRLAQTWEKLPMKFKKSFDDHLLLIDPSRNHRAYRLQIAKMEPPIIPFMPLILKDLTFVHEGNKTYVENKMHLIAEILRNVNNYRSRHFDEVQNNDFHITTESTANIILAKIKNTNLSKEDYEKYVRNIKVIDNHERLVELSYKIESKKR
ncbi:unnamed protein product [Gordionus sp. m RMFG-2023]